MSRVMQRERHMRGATPVVALLACAVLVGWFGSPGTARAARVAGVDFAETISVGDLDLRLHGVGLLRYKIFFDGYAAALYLGPDTDADRVLEDGARRLEIEYFWEIPADLFVETTREGIRKNVGDARYRDLEEKIERFNGFYADVKPGDRYQLTHRPGVGTELALNGQVRGVVPGAEFAAAVFAIWLGDEPFSASLKEQLLGPRQASD